MTTLASKPPKTKVDWTNETEMYKFKERRRFETWRQKGHFYFDKIWMDAKLMTREECYKWLAENLNIKESQAHFRRLSNEQCAEAIELCQQLLNDNRRMDLDFGQEPITPFYSI